jgi:hypothetical protein
MVHADCAREAIDFAGRVDALDPDPLGSQQIAEGDADRSEPDHDDLRCIG